MAQKVKKLKKSKQLKMSDIVKDTNPLIREVSTDVIVPLEKENIKIMEQLIDYTRTSQDPIANKERNLRPAMGISAIQIGHKRKLLYVRIENEFGSEAEEFALANPKIIKRKGKAFLESGEGCLSVDYDVEGYVIRDYQIVVEAYDYFTSRHIQIETKGMTSIVLQHEIDHLYGIMFYDRINKLRPFEAPKDALRIK